MDEAGKSAWCRASGVYPQELEAGARRRCRRWPSPRRCVPARSRPSRIGAGSRSSSASYAANKALAEAAALLVLSKKLEASSTRARTNDRTRRSPDLLARDIRQAHQAGARLDRACALAGIDVRTLQRWSARDGAVAPTAGPRPCARLRHTTLSAEERAQLLCVANEPRFADMPPARIVPALADEGIYLASESFCAACCVTMGRTGTGAERGRHARAGRRPRTWRRHRASCGAGT